MKQTIKNYLIKTPDQIIPVSGKCFTAVLRIANHISWSRNIDLSQIDIIPIMGL